MTGQSHAAILLILVALIVGIAAWSRTDDPSLRAASNISWVCSSQLDSLNCFLASLTR